MRETGQFQPGQYHQPVATLPIINLNRIYDSDPLECNKLQDACSRYGFFHLDLSGYPDLLLLWQRLLEFSRAYFSQGMELKLSNDHKSELYGGFAYHIASFLKRNTGPTDILL